MGGNSAPRFLRMAGKDTFVLTPAVVTALNQWGAFKGEPKNKADRAKVQAIFNAWAKETGLPLAHLSMTLAASVGSSERWLSRRRRRVSMTAAPIGVVAYRSRTAPMFRSP